MSTNVEAVPGVQLQLAGGMSGAVQPVVDTDGQASALQLATGVVSVTGNLLVGTTGDPGYTFQVGIGKPIRFDLQNGAFLSVGPGLVLVDAPGIPGGRLAITDDGNVGIGNPHPQFKLDVAGVVNATGFRVNGNATIPGVQPESSAPAGARLQGLFIDPQTGIVYYHD
jgi:hypothetical protein